MKNYRKYALAFGIILLILSCSSTKFNKKWAKLEAPDTFSTRFETNEGDFEIEVERILSPKAADRFYQLVKSNYFENILFYRVNPEFVAQFGGHDTLIYTNWNAIKIPDEPVLAGNNKGTLSFARGGKESRGTDLFINLSDNNRLDTINYNDVTGFPTFGKVTKGMHVLEKLYSGYADTTMDTLGLMYTNLDAFIKMYPKLDTIHKAYIIK